MDCMNILFSGFCGCQAAREAKGPPFFPRQLSIPKGTIAMTYIFTERFHAIPSPLIVRVKLPVGYIGPEIETEYLIEGDVEDFKQRLDKNDIRTSRLVIMEEHDKTATSGKIEVEATVKTSPNSEMKISATMDAAKSQV